MKQQANQQKRQTKSHDASCIPLFVDLSVKLYQEL